MTHIVQTFKPSLRRLVTALIVLSAGCASQSVPQRAALNLTGAQEVPAAATSAAGAGEIVVLPDRSVSGSISTFGIASIAANIHAGARGTIGPVVIALTQTSQNIFVVPPGAKLTELQYLSYREGNLYVNVHSAAYPAGEIRAQLVQPMSAAMRSSIY